MIKKLLPFLLILGFVYPIQTAIAADTDKLSFAEEKVGGYNRNLFKHWTDIDSNGCNTRQEVLIEEATVKPKIGKKCVLSGGTWLSSYDNKTVKGSGSTLDVDHLVPLAEAWRSGAWQWTNAERELFANDLQDSRVLIAVTASSNRSKGDKDLSNWLPKASKEVVCDYVFDWIAVKLRYYLSIDPKEAAVIERIAFEPSCNARNASKISKPLKAFEKYHANYNTPTPTPSVTPTPTPTQTPTQTPSPTPTATTFKMPLIFGKVGTVLANWSNYGFAKAPITSSLPSPLKDYSCLPISNEDSVFDTSPKFNADVDRNTQVTLLTLCNMDLKNPKPTTPTATPTPTPTTVATPTPTTVATPTPTPTKTKPTPIKYKNCTEAKAAGVTPIRKSTDPELYALNAALDGDKDGDACEN